MDDNTAGAQADDEVPGFGRFRGTTKFAAPSDATEFAKFPLGRSAVESLLAQDIILDLRRPLTSYARGKQHIWRVLENAKNNGAAEPDPLCMPPAVAAVVQVGDMTVARLK